MERSVDKNQFAMELEEVDRPTCAFAVRYRELLQTSLKHTVFGIHDPGGIKEDEVILA